LKKFPHRLLKMCRGLKGRNEMRWEISFWVVRVGRRGNKGWNLKGMEMDGRRGFVVSQSGLANVSDSGNIMNWYVV